MEEDDDIIVLFFIITIHFNLNFNLIRFQLFFFLIDPFS